MRFGSQPEEDIKAIIHHSLAWTDPRFYWQDWIVKIAKKIDCDFQMEKGL